MAAALIAAGVQRDDKVLMNAFTLAPVAGAIARAGCFSSQSFKHVNSGEGGLLVTDDEDIAAKAVLLSGSYMLYEQHGARPAAEVFERHRLTT